MTGRHIWIKWPGNEVRIVVHILLLILKAIGILILVLLGLVLAVVCLVLFVPV